MVLKLLLSRVRQQQLGTEKSVFEPTSPSSGFDNLSPTSCPQCGGRRKVGGEDLIIRPGFTKPSPYRTLRAPWVIPRGSFFSPVSAMTDMPQVTITRRLQFNAAHRVHNPALSDEENIATFGKCNNPNWHGHNYTLDVSVTGPVDPRTGYVIDLGKLKAIVEREVVNKVDHRNFNSKSTSCRASSRRPRTSSSRCGACSSPRSAGAADPARALGNAEQLRRVRRPMTSPRSRAPHSSPAHRAALGWRSRARSSATGLQRRDGGARRRCAHARPPNRSDRSRCRSSVTSATEPRSATSSGACARHSATRRT